VEFLWGALTAVIGALIGFFADIAKTRLGEKAERRRAIKERSDKAAQELLPLLDEALAHFEGAPQHGDSPDYDSLVVTLGKISQKTILLADPQVRQQMDSAVEILSGYSAVEQFAGDVPRRIAYLTWDESRETLARSLNDQPFETSEILKTYQAAVDEERQLYAEAMESERKRRIAEAED
jgi:hypothetical protein